MNKKSSVVVWIASINALSCLYVLWTYYRALRFQITADVPSEITAAQILFVSFECLNFVLCLLYLRSEFNSSLQKVLVGLSILQLIALCIAPFLIAATVMPRVL